MISSFFIFIDTKRSRLTCLECLEYSEIKTSYETPHFVTCGKIYNNVYQMACSGSIVSHHFVLTAKMCAQQNQPVCDVIEIERYNRKLYFKISKWISSNYQEDGCPIGIGLLKLDETLSFDHQIRPACLTSRDYNHAQHLNLPGILVNQYISSFNFVGQNRCQMMANIEKTSENCKTALKNATVCISPKSKVVYE